MYCQMSSFYIDLFFFIFQKTYIRCMDAPFELLIHTIIGIRVSFSPEFMISINAIYRTFTGQSLKQRNRHINIRFFSRLAYCQITHGKNQIRVLPYDLLHQVPIAFSKCSIVQISYHYNTDRCRRFRNLSRQRNPVVSDNYSTHNSTNPIFCLIV